jgi:hypothetical protein
VKEKEAMFSRVIVALVAVLAVAANGVFGKIVERPSELVLQEDHLVGEVVRSPRPVYNASTIPDSLDYRAQGLLTADLNQHIPVYW